MCIDSDYDWFIPLYEYSYFYSLLLKYLSIPSEIPRASFF